MRGEEKEMLVHNQHQHLLSLPSLGSDIIILVISRIHPKLFGHDAVMTDNGRICERFVRSNLLIFRNLKIASSQRTRPACRKASSQ
jgi:hypothetical protein